ncbi:phage regulatory CII family protein [Enterovibrio sp. ZSDZ42]|uniref:Phage regulatory CII family protein n=1 Tax=Enterovibrio gelatinilyticus TaxID=2899819 RepID=A0ABT5QWZ5_9GAMM|nr:phage regulatory CII family protein [Enterovibrio sp. ZSDZ42]MDD1792547.1 phage regulatory CII family protein [Enterovibrio sp. ZSDZ42]
MTQINQMSGSRENEQNAYNAACVAFSKLRLTSGLEREMGLCDGTLRNRLNPNNLNANLTVKQLIEITNRSGRTELVDGVLQSVNMVGAPLNGSDTEATLAIHALKASQYSGELAQIALQNANAQRLPRTERDRIREIASAGIRNFVSVINTIEYKTAGIQPLLAMGADVVTGLPLPGIA